MYCFLPCVVVIWVRNKIFSLNWAYLRVSRNYLKKIISNDEKEFLIKISMIIIRKSLQVQPN